MNKKEDKRKIKSKENINKTFLTLLQENSVSEMTITSITQRANINRSTFYLHYKDKYDLFEQYVNDLLNEMIEIIDKTTLGNKENRIHKEQMQSLFKHLFKNVDFYKPMFNNKGGAYFYNEFFKRLERLFKQRTIELNLTNQTLKIDEQITSSFVIYGFFGIINYWFKGNMKESIEMIGYQLEMLLNHMGSYTESH